VPNALGINVRVPLSAEAAGAKAIARRGIFAQVGFELGVPEVHLHHAVCKQVAEMASKLVHTDAKIFSGRAFNLQLLHCGVQLLDIRLRCVERVGVSHRLRPPRSSVPTPANPWSVIHLGFLLESEGQADRAATLVAAVGVVACVFLSVQTAGEAAV